MKIVLTGATGFVGSVLAPKLLAGGHEVAALVRNTERAQRILPPQVAALPWEAGAGAAAMEGAGALIHLAGESVAAGRWSGARRKRIQQSRGPALERLLRSVSARSPKQSAKAPGVVISASAVGYYGNRGAEELIETSPPGEGFLAELCRDWEGALQTGAGGKSRRVALRIGMVLGRNGGALARILPVFRAGLGGRLGNGRQWMSWIHMEDLTGLILFALESPALSGAVNAVAPEPVTNSEFTRTLAEVLHRPAFFHAPAFALKRAMGEMSSILLESQRVLPAAAQANGFTFRFPTLRAALADLCGKRA